MAEDYSVDKLDETIIIKLSEPYQNVDMVMGYVDDVEGEDNYNKFDKFFRWSQDNSYFSEWLPLTNLNLQNQIIKNDKPFWIEYKYVVTDIQTGVTLVFKSISLEILSSQGIVTDVKQVSVDCCEPGQIPSGCANLILTDGCDPDNLFNPYGSLNNTLGMFNQLTNVVNDIFGHCVKYYKVGSDDRSRDVILHEYSLYNVISVKDIKVLVPDNAFPTNEFQFDQFGMGIEGFEIHITRQEFQTAFGARTRPEERDYIYFPIVDRMYEVNSIALADPVVYKDVYYKVTLRKWQERANVTTPPEIEQELDTLTLSVDELFDTEKNEEILKVTKPQQYKTIGTGANDYVRSELSTQLSISDNKINNNWVIVSKNYYELDKLIYNELAVKYRQRAKITYPEDRSFTFWVQPSFGAERAYSAITSIVNVGGKVGIVLNKEMPWVPGDMINVTGTNTFNGYHRLLQIDTGNVYVLNHPYINSVANNPQARSLVKSFLLYGYGQQSVTGLSIELTKNWIIISVNNVDYIFVHGVNLDNTKWYSIVVNLSNQFNTLSYYLYELNKQQTYTMPQNETSALTLLNKQIENLSSQVTINPLDNWSLVAGPIRLTNIRVFTRIIPEDEHNIVLNQYVVHDTQWAELVDNAIPEIHLLRIPNPR